MMALNEGFGRQAEWQWPAKLLIGSIADGKNISKCLNLFNRLKTSDQKSIWKKICVKYFTQALGQIVGFNNKDI